MKVNRIIKLTVAMFAGVTLLAACGSQNSNKKGTNSVQTEKKQSQAEINARGVVAAINHKHPHFKMLLNGGPSVVGVNVEDNNNHTYGFNDNNKGISTVAFGIQNGLNRGETGMIEPMLDNAKDKDGNEPTEIGSELGEKEIDVHNLVGDTFTINDLKFVKSSKDMKIEGHATANFHIGNGKEQHREYTINHIVDKNDKKDDGNSKPIKKSEKKDTLDTDYKNVDVPQGKGGVVNQLDANL